MAIKERRRCPHSHSRAASTAGCLRHRWRCAPQALAAYGARIMQAVTTGTECLSCALEARADLPPRERLHVGLRWRAAHAFGTSLPGWLVVLPRRHVTALDQLT